MEKSPEIEKLVDRLHETLSLAGLKIDGTVRADVVYGGKRFIYSRSDHLTSEKFYYVTVSFNDCAETTSFAPRVGKKVNVKSELRETNGAAISFGNEDLLVKPGEEHRVIDKINEQLAELFKLVDSIIQTLGPRRITG